MLTKYEIEEVEEKENNEGLLKIKIFDTDNISINADRITINPINYDYTLTRTTGETITLNYDTYYSTIQRPETMPYYPITAIDETDYNYLEDIPF